jgi:DNA-binding CsgD family transcriptional regulator
LRRVLARGILALIDFVEIVGRVRRLSPQHRLVFALLCISATDDFIIDALNITRSTTRHYIDRVLDRVGVDSRDELAFAYAEYASPSIAHDLMELFSGDARKRVEKLLACRRRVRGPGSA